MRVVSVGADIDALLAEPDSDKWQAMSVEFCGGTHLDDAKEARYFAIVQEEVKIVEKCILNSVHYFGCRACRRACAGLLDSRATLPPLPSMMERLC